MKCESCDAEATMHITEVFGDALVAERHMCMVCASRWGCQPVRISRMQCIASANC